MNSSASKDGSLSIVLPTYNCRDLIERHISSMQMWIDLADEVIVVDSKSNDGTLELIRERLKHPKLLIIERQPGLYESWNEAIASTTGEWIYISTAGDLISRKHLLRLKRAGEAYGADVVISPQRFVDSQGAPISTKTLRNPRIYAAFKDRGIAILPPSAVHFFAFERGKPNALLGSIAGDLFCGNHLRSRPFPCEYGTHGDTAWILRYGRETRLCLLPEGGSDFCVHPKSSIPAETLSETLYRIYKIESTYKKTPSDFKIYHFLLNKVSLYWKKKRASMKSLLVGKAINTIVYLYFRFYLGSVEQKIRRKIMSDVKFFPADFR